VLIAAHTKKPRVDDVKRGRALTNLVSGSVALTNTARCVYMLLPWDEEPEETRVYFCCAKLNDGAMYPASVWHRRFANFFEHDPGTDPARWGMEKLDEAGKERRAMTVDMFQAIYEKAQRPSLQKNELVKLMVQEFGISEATAYRAIGKDGYATVWFLPETAGMWALRPEYRERDNPS
jgi:hypothetical protein